MTPLAAAAAAAAGRDDEDQIVAVIYTTGGEVYDFAYTWETAQSMVLNDGYVAVAIKDDGAMTREDAQALYTREREVYVDCWS